MKGFFDTKDLVSVTRPTGRVLSCVSCGLYKNARSPKMKPYGNFKKRIMIIGDAPDETEDRQGKPWQGKQGRFLQRALENLGIDLFEDCVSIYTGRCRPMNTDGDTRSLETHEIDCCRRFLLKDIQEYAPQVIIPLGGSAIISLLNYRWKRDLGGITKWRGWRIPDQDFVTWVCPTFHPSFVMLEDRMVETVWKQDLAGAIDCVGKTVPKNKNPKIHILQDISELNSIIFRDLVAFDYETTGIKPHGANQRIVCASIASDENTAYAFMMPERKEDCLPFTKILEDASIGKLAQNMKFEDTWTVIRLGSTVKNWAWDSMLAAHILDNRPGITSLKFQTYVNFGIVDYESEVSSYLHSDDKDGNGINKIDKLLESESGKEKLLHYCALDSIYEYRLAMKQIDIIGYDFLPF